MIPARQDSQYLQLLVITYYLLPAYLQRHRGIVPKSSGLRRNKYYPLNWNPTSGFFNISYPHRDGLWGTSPLISSDHAEPSQIVPANSDQARLINPSPRIFTLLPTAALERCAPSEFLPSHHPWSNEARPHEAAGVGTNLELCLHATSRPLWPFSCRNTLHVFVNQLTRELSYTLLSLL